MNRTSPFGPPLVPLGVAEYLCPRSWTWGAQTICARKNALPSDQLSSPSPSIRTYQNLSELSLQNGVSMESSVTEFDPADLRDQFEDWHLAFFFDARSTFATESCTNTHSIAQSYFSWWTIRKSLIPGTWYVSFHCTQVPLPYLSFPFPLASGYHVYSAKSLCDKLQARSKA